jgi:Ubiquitin family
VLQVKQKIEAEHKMQADMMKLIAYGKVLDDDSKQIKEFNLKDGDQIVVMISKVFSSLLIIAGQAPAQSPNRGPEEPRRSSSLAESPESAASTKLTSSCSIAVAPTGLRHPSLA